MQYQLRGKIPENIDALYRQIENVGINYRSIIPNEGYVSIETGSLITLSQLQALAELGYTVRPILSDSQEDSGVSASAADDDNYDRFPILFDDGKKG